MQVFDEDKMKQDKRLGIAKLPLSDLGMETAKEVNLQLLSSLDTTKVKDKKDRGVLTIKARSDHLAVAAAFVFSSPPHGRLPDCALQVRAGGVPPVHQGGGAGGPGAGEADRGGAAEGEERDGGRQRRRRRGQ